MLTANPDFAYGKGGGLLTVNLGGGGEQKKGSDERSSSVVAACVINDVASTLLDDYFLSPNDIDALARRGDALAGEGVDGCVL